MRVASVELTNFRSYAKAGIDLAPAVNLVVGDNGQGKTNLLEAMGLLSIGRSVRGAPDADMVRWGAEASLVACRLCEGADERLALEIRPGERKSATIDGAPLTVLSDLVGIVRSVHLSPETIDGSIRSPAGRRKMLDVLLSQVDRRYLDGLKRHRQIVVRLNSLYKRTTPHDGEMDVWERQLAEVATDIGRRRAEVLPAVAESAAGHFATLFGGTRLDLRIHPSLPVEDGADACEEALAAARDGALRVGHVTKGAHRDRVDVLVDDRDLESHASQGQVKGAYFAWKFAEGDVIQAETDVEPIWLVDDPFSELDRTRALALLEAFSTKQQVVITTARDADLGLDKIGYPSWWVHDGEIEPR